MSMLIKGMDMPKEGTYILNFISSESGKHTICLIEKEHDDGGAELIENNGVVEIKTPHGRLIDAEELIDSIPTVDQYDEGLADWFIKITEGQPTVIEAEGEE